MKPTPNPGIRRQLAALWVGLLALTMASASPAAEPVGRVIAATGAVTAVGRDEREERSLERGDAVHAGDTLRTGENGRVQVRFEDDALMSLVPDSHFEIERYDTGENAGEVVLRLIEGALRTITGAIGGEEDERYELTTPVATVGIRGTEYSLDFCAVECAGTNRRPGLFGRVDEGAVTVSSETGSGAFRAGEYFYVAQPAGMPEPISTPPEGLRFDQPGAGAGSPASARPGTPRRNGRESGGPPGHSGPGSEAPGKGHGPDRDPPGLESRPDSPPSTPQGRPDHPPGQR